MNDGQGPLATILVVGLHDYCFSYLDVVLCRLVDEVVTFPQGGQILTLPSLPQVILAGNQVFCAFTEIFFFDSPWLFFW